MNATPNILRVALALTLTTTIGCRALVEAALVPRLPFADTEPPAAPNYNSNDAWAARPELTDFADVTPAGVSDNQSSATADVFFIHPTTYYTGASWNQPLDHTATNDRTDQAVMRGQASAFNGAGRIFAPRYRQATLGAYLADPVNRDEAIALAYSDVRAAFDHYLNNNNQGRPLIIASHSQGSGHAARLLSESFSELAAVDQRALLVAAYTIGWTLPETFRQEALPGLPLCETPTQTRCFVTYNTIADGTDPDRFSEIRTWFPDGPRTIEAPELLCVNPVSWSTDQAASDPSAHLGRVNFGDGDSPQPQPESVIAQCLGGLLESDLMDQGEGLASLRDDLHTLDYRLFYMNIRSNAVQRVAAFVP